MKQTGRLAGQIVTKLRVTDAIRAARQMSFQYVGGKVGVDLLHGHKFARAFHLREGGQEVVSTVVQEDSATDSERRLVATASG